MNNKFLKYPISIKQANKIYLKIERLKNIKLFKDKKYFKYFKFLHLSLKCSRDIFDLNSAPLDTLFLIGQKNIKLSNELNLSLTPNQKLAYGIGYFLKTFKISISLRNFFLLSNEYFKFIVKVLISIFDIFLIFFLSFFSIIKNKFNSNLSESLKDINEIYTFLFWKDKKLKSIEYYYPDFFNRDKAIAYVSNFYKYKSFFIGLLSIYKYKKIFSFLNFITFKSLIKSYIQLFLLYIFDLRIFFKPSYGLIIKYFQSFKSLNSRLLSLLDYNVSESLLRDYSIKNYYIWFENQSSNKGLSLGLSNYIKFIIKRNINIYFYYGFIFSKNSLPQYTPSDFELLNSNYINNQFLLQSIESAVEMKLIFSKKNLSCTVDSVRNSLKRYSISSQNNIESSKKYSRSITIFAGHEINELFLIFYKLFGKRNNNGTFSYKKFYEEIYIRLHPSLNKDKTMNSLLTFKKKYNLVVPKIIFIDNKIESFGYSLKNSRIAVFANSTYINLALTMNIDVVAVRTSFLSQPPIFQKFKDSNLVKLIN